MPPKPTCVGGDQPSSAAVIRLFLMFGLPFAPRQRQYMCNLTC